MTLVSMMVAHNDALVSDLLCSELDRAEATGTRSRAVPNREIYSGGKNKHLILLKNYIFE